MKKTVVVLGGLGFIGSHLSNMLNKKFNVIIYDDFSNASGKNSINKNIKIVKGDILDFNKIKKIITKSNIVFNLAVKPLPMSFDKPDEVVKTNDFGAYLVAKSCSESNIKLIHVSSSEAYGTAKKVPMKESHPFFPTTIYAASKASSELYVKGLIESDKLKAVIIRPFNSYGPFMRDDMYAAAIPKFFHRIKNDQYPIIYGNGNQTRDFTYVEDTARGIFLASQKSNALGKIFNIGYGKEISINEIAFLMMEKFEKITGKKVTNKIYFKKERKGDVRRHLADIKFAKELLGYKPEIKIDEGIEKYISWKINST